MTTDAINAALSGLRVTQQALDLTAVNVANAQTEGYTRKILPQDSLVIGNRGVGVRAGEIQRYVDQSLLRDYRTQIGVETGLSVRESYLSRIQSFHGSSDKESSLASRLNALASSFTTLSADPDNATAQQAAVDKAVNLAATINKYADFLVQLRTETQNALSTEVNNVNLQLKTIADFNKRIEQLKFVGSSSASLEDLRDVAIKKLSELIDVSYFEDGNGMLVVQTRNGQVLADGEAHPLTFVDGNMTYAASYPDSLSGVTVAAGTIGALDLTATTAGGKIGALLSLRDQELPTYIAQIDELAHKIAMRFDAQGVRLFTDQTGTVPPDSPSMYLGFAQNMRVNQAVLADPSRLQQGTSGPAIDAGSSAVLDKIISFTFGKSQDASGTPHPAFNLSGTGPGGTVSFTGLIGSNASLDEFARAMLGSQAEQHSLTNSQLTTEKAYTQEVQKRLLDGSTVSTDEEMATLIELQKHYTASAKVINALDELFRDLLNAF
ncbi:MAG TPA: flagellar hook-associated protein FlgK [Alphaproteobacteria bacterium]